MTISGVLPEDGMDMNLNERAVDWDFFGGYVKDLERMLDHCREQGKDVPASELALGIAYALKGRPTPRTGDEIDSLAKNIAMVLEVHGRLSALIAPATPRTLASTEYPPPGLSPAWRTYELLIGLGVLTLNSLLGFLLTLP